ncbi:Para-nitrophenol 4-monooxygenase [Cytospora mali]|uniref:Para-nitrophenol 4-monooxygenase n=1 Tax=Cytospora mali TaxID=578113 RepID=A0A194UP04_CYTMA|nr:Para-nitrophenol 4-monooxygenase [Valsa mali var. pyri (nom. inval.)]
MMGINTRASFEVVIVGAGPAGLIIALMLAQKGMSATVLEKSTEIDRNPRACFYSSPAIHELRRAGLMEDIMKRAFVPDGATWRYLGGEKNMEKICTVHAHNPPGAETMISLPLDELLPLMAEHLSRYPSAKVLLSHQVVSIGQNENKAWVDVRTPDGDKRFEADYIVGCDGANSKVRRELFGDNFPGFTWDKQIVATNVYWPKFKDYNWTSSTFMIHPEHFPMIAQIARDGLLRITYGEEGGLTREQMRERQPWKYKQFVPGAPEPDEYRIVNFSPYRVHQRTKGRETVDSIPVVNGMSDKFDSGGMGLMGGLVDAGNLFDCLYGIATGQADDSILEKYSEIRIRKYKDIIDPVSSGNIQRLWDPSPETIKADTFFQAIQLAEKDEEFADQMAKVSIQDYSVNLSEKEITVRYLSTY